MRTTREFGNIRTRTSWLTLSFIWSEPSFIHFYNVTLVEFTVFLTELRETRTDISKTLEYHKNRKRPESLHNRRRFLYPFNDSKRIE